MWRDASAYNNKGRKCTYLPDIEFNTDSREDADKYAEIKKRSDEERDYIVLTLD